MSPAHANARLEAFSDGVFAIALTLLIIEVKLPAGTHVASVAELWGAIHHLVPLFVAFILSFAVILITWVNHHATLKLVPDSSAAFIYANGFLLFTVVVIPFPTALLGEYGFTDHGAPAVMLYNAVLALQAISWVLVTGTAVKGQLTRNERSVATLRVNGRHGYFAFALYALLAILAAWFPFAVAIVTIVTWVFWLGLGIRMKDA